MPKVSVLVPVYNVENYLRECLDSLISQTLNDIEIICINDGSTDSSPEIIKEYAEKDTRIKVIDKPNSGYGDSMNFGAERATGEYIGILESDDFTGPEMYEDLYNLARSKDADLVISDFYLYWTKKNKIKKVNSTSKYPEEKVTNIKETPLLIRNKTTIWAAIYKRDFIFKNNIKFLPTPGASYQDTSFRIKTISLADRIVCTPKAYTYYRQDNINSSIHSKEKAFAICGEYGELTAFMNSHSEIKKYANSEKLINQWNGYMWNYKRIDENDKDEFLQKFYDDFKKFFDNGEIDSHFFTKVNKKLFNMLINNREKFKRTCTEKNLINRISALFRIAG